MFTTDMLSYDRDADVTVKAYQFYRLYPHQRKVLAELFESLLIRPESPTLQTEERGITL